ncbi:MAG TPA: hypothetical protein VK416_10505, partial [Thermoanaerobaculia bacterium]|nr:hypothetical protein [Thermoanaerobaculia bacterium]
GYFEVDVLADVDSGELYLGEINPRISGVTSMTNATAGAYADLPLFGFHLLEFMDVDYEIDVDDINHRWAQAETVDVWSQLIIKEPEDRVELLTSTPRTGVWRIDPLTGRIHFGRWANDWHSIVDEDEAFFLRILPTEDYRYKGADLGVLVSKSRMQTDDFTLTERSRQWIAGIRDQYAGTRWFSRARPSSSEASTGRWISTTVTIRGSAPRRRRRSVPRAIRSFPMSPSPTSRGEAPSASRS